VSGHYPPISCEDFKAILKTLGFSPRPQKGTSHQQWVKIVSGRLYKVTVDCPKAPFTRDMIMFMARQAGVSKKRIYEIYGTI
jgi:predicted RNA binding protein YcfA (HicA-like mRNA interferase family)